MSTTIASASCADLRFPSRLCRKVTKGTISGCCKGNLGNDLVVLAWYADTAPEAFSFDGLCL